MLRESCGIWRGAAEEHQEDVMGTMGRWRRCPHLGYHGKDPGEGESQSQKVLGGRRLFREFVELELPGLDTFVLGR